MKCSKEFAVYAHGEQVKPSMQYSRIYTLVRDGWAEQTSAVYKHFDQIDLAEGLYGALCPRELDSLPRRWFSLNWLLNEG